MDVIMLIAFLAVLSLPNVFKRLNVTMLAVSIAFIAGFFIMVPGKGYSVSSAVGAGSLILKGLPATLLFNIIMASLFFAVARQNGTLESLTKKLLKLAKGNNKILPFLIFLLGFSFSIIGTGTIPVSIMLYPLIYEISTTQRLDYLTCAIALAMGNHVGGLAPTAPVGMIAASTAAQFGVSLGWNMWKEFALIGVLVFIVFYILSGGWKVANSNNTANLLTEKFNKEQIVTLVSILSFAACVLGLRLNVGFCATIGVLLLLIINRVDFGNLVKMVPWNTVILVGGMSMFAQTMSLAGTMNMVTKGLLSFVGPITVCGILVLASGAMSMVSSASGVVIPTMVPIAITLATSMNINPVPLITAVCFGSHRTASSPLSTGGGLIIGLRGPVSGEDTLYYDLFKWVFVTWGVSAILAFAGVLNWV